LEKKVIIINDIQYPILIIKDLHDY
jgi:hypothetical protein